MDNGLNTNALPTVNVIDSLMGNYAGSTAQIQIVRLVSLVAALMGPTHATRALLYADLAWAAGSVGYVRADTTTAYNGVYKKSGAAGAGSWARVGDLPTGALEASQLATIQGEAALVETNVGRPGINPARFDVRAAADLSNVGTTRSAISAGRVIANADGAAVRLSAEEVLSTAARVALPDGVVQRVSGLIRRAAMTGDAADHTVELCAAYRNSLGTVVSTQVLASWSVVGGNPLAGGEVARFSVPVGPATGTGPYIKKASANCIYATFYLRTYGDLHQTDIAEFTVTDDTDESAIRAEIIGSICAADVPAFNRSAYGLYPAAQTSLIGLQALPILRAPVDVSGVDVGHGIELTGGEALALGRRVSLSNGRVYEISGMIARPAGSLAGATETVQVKLRNFNAVGGPFVTETVLADYSPTGLGVIAAGAFVTFKARIAIVANTAFGVAAALAGAKAICPVIQTAGGTHKTQVVFFGIREISARIADASILPTDVVRQSGGKIPTWLIPDVYLTADALDPMLSEAEFAAKRGAANGVAPLGPDGKIAATYLDTSALAGTPKGNWTPTSNTPTLAGGGGSVGEYYDILTPGTSAAPIIATWAVGDQLVRGDAGWYRRAAIPSTRANLIETNPASPAYVQGIVDTAVTETIGPSSDHASLHDAMVSTGRRRITSGGNLTLQFSAGTHVNNINDSDTLMADGGRITIKGEQWLGAGKARLSQASLPNTLWDAGAGALKSGAAFDAAYAADRATILAQIRDRYATVVECPTNRGFARMQGGQLRQISDLALINTAAAPGYCLNAGDFGAMMFGIGSFLHIDRLAIFGFDVAYNSCYGGGLRLGADMLIAGCNKAVQGQYGGLTYAHDNLAAYTPRGQWVMSHNDWGIFVKGGGNTCYFPGGLVQCSANTGIWGTHIGYPNINNTYFEYNKTYGGQLIGASPGDFGSAAEASHFYRNGAGGLVLQDCYGVISALNMTSAENGGAYDLQVMGQMGMIDITGHNSGMRISPDSDPLIKVIGR